jgi:hypothetical protein
MPNWFTDPLDETAQGKFMQPWRRLTKNLTFASLARLGPPLHGSADCQAFQGVPLQQSSR